MRRQRPSAGRPLWLMLMVQPIRRQFIQRRVVGGEVVTIRVRSVMGFC
jgi:hypothetical protein